MKLVILSVDLDDKMETPVPTLEEGEHIVTKVVEISKLHAELEGMSIHFIFVIVR